MLKKLFVNSPKYKWELLILSVLFQFLGWYNKYENLPPGPKLQAATP